MSQEAPISLQVVLFDFGGVLAEEGFVAGLKAIAERHGLEPEPFFRRADEIIYDCGYLTGNNTEHGYWNEIRKEFGIAADDRELTGEIHRRFVLRPGMLAKARALKAAGLRPAILSDQTDWLEQLDRRHHFLAGFDPVLNSYDLGRTKREAATFAVAAKILGAPPAAILFVDDNAGHIGRARDMGLQTHHFIDEAGFSTALAARHLPSLSKEN